MNKIIIVLALILITLSGCTQNKINKSDSMNYKKLSPEEENVIINKGTERPFTGKYYKTFDKGVYVCKRCGKPLYRSSDKFESECGWPSFDDEIKGAVTRTLDADGRRTEITCNNCGAHLGHVFIGEHLTQKDTRHCVNSISLEFIPDDEKKTDTAIFAGGCFWGVEYYMQKSKGVISTEVGYIGGHKDNPTYADVCTHTTGHAEAIRIVFNPSQITYEDLAKLFFEIHDPTQVDRQGPDVGDQYRSEVFFLDDLQKETALNLISILKGKGYKVATKVTKASTFWKAEDYHQQYYTHKGSMPYCHRYEKKF